MRPSRITSFFLSAILFSVGCTGDDDNQGQQRSRPVPTVETVVAQFGTLPLEERLNGSVRAFNQTDIFAEINAPVMEVLVNNGDDVRAGQPLVRLRDTEARERLSQAQSSLEISEAQLQQTMARLEAQRAQLNRIQQLASRDLQSQSELEQLQSEVMALEATRQLNEAQVRQARSVVNERENDLSVATVKAPISGIVGQRNAEVGQQVNASTRLFQIGDLNRMKVQVTLTETMLSRIRTGMRVQVTSPAFGDSVITARVSRISPFLNPVTHTAEAEIEIENPDRMLRPGMFVNVDIFYGDSDQATLVPNNAIYRHPREGFEGVFVAPSLMQELNFAYEDGQEIPQMVGPTGVEFRRIEIVARGRMVTAVRGIDPQTHVVTLGQNLLADGSESARVRQVDWEHILNLQQMQSRDLIRIIHERSASRQNGVGSTGGSTQFQPANL
ncbi:MAG: efflux RND transporter periplasmic adaptor subunit [Balneolales bacterium]|nr:efflux RND transporter periplasmic adaptor subunit [Balneolales bacterium]